MDLNTARKVIVGDSDTGDILKRLEAIEIAVEFLGEDCTMADVWKWAEEKED